MSSNKTIIPGMENTYTVSSPSFNQPEVKETNGTRVPHPFDINPVTEPSHKPIVGFLYSISKSVAGEYWPLYIGPNSIGRSLECSVCLSEATVSERHALLVVRQLKNPEKMIASICDSQSTCGTMINGQSLGFDQQECFNGDIITIGEHYDLYLILIDPKLLGLNVCTSFMPTSLPSAKPENPPISVNSHAAPSSNRFTQVYDANNIGTQAEPPMGPPSTKPGNKSGRTIFM